MKPQSPEIAKRKQEHRKNRVASTPSVKSSAQPNSGDGIAGWGQPVPLSRMSPVPSFPVEVFPARVASYWLAAAEALGTPVDYIAVPGMVLLGTAIGRTRAAEVKTSYSELPCLWAAVVAPPGSAKSAALRFARGPLSDAEMRWMDEHRAALQGHDVEMERHGIKMKEWKVDGCRSDPPEKPRRPSLRQTILDDTTVEAAVKILNENPSGIAIVKDELIGFVKALNQYRSGKGADREFWLSAWAGAPAKVNRSSGHDVPLYIPAPVRLGRRHALPGLTRGDLGDLGETLATGTLRPTDSWTASCFHSRTRRKRRLSHGRPFQKM